MPTEMRVSGSENFQNTSAERFSVPSKSKNRPARRSLFSRIKKSSGGEDSATGQCGASFYLEEVMVVAGDRKEPTFPKQQQPSPAKPHRGQQSCARSGCPRARPTSLM
jgi:hypothetical protein